jgi:hypothetical protein
VPQDGPAGEGQRCYRRQQVQGHERSRQQLHARKIQRRQKQIEESVARYMTQLDAADPRTAAGGDPSEAVLLTKTRL